MSEFDSDDFDEEGISDGLDFEAPGVGPVGAEDEDADAIFDVDQSADEDGETTSGEPKAEYGDDLRAELIAEMRAEDIDVPSQAPAPVEPEVNEEFEGRIDFDPNFNEDPEVAEQQLTEQYLQQKADAELAEHKAFLQAALQRQAEARARVQAPVDTKVDVPEPNMMERLTESQLDDLIRWRDEGTGPEGPGVEDLGAFYGSLLGDR